MRRLSRILLGGVTFVALLLPASAVAKPGDLYVGDPGFSPEPGRIVRISHSTGHQKVIASGGELVAPDSGAFGGRRKLFIADYDAPAVFRVNPATGGVTATSSDPKLNGPTDVAIAGNGTLFAIDPFAGTPGPPFGDGAVFRINRQSGNATIVSQDHDFNGGPLGGAVLPSGKIVVADQDAGPSGAGALLKVNPANGNQTFVTQGGHLDDPYGMTLTPNGKTAFVADTGSNAIVRVTIGNGNQRVVASGGSLNFPTDVALGLDGKLYAVGYTSTEADVTRINRRTGHQHVFASNHHLSAPEGITVQPRG